MFGIVPNSTDQQEPTRLTTTNELTGPEPRPTNIVRSWIPPGPGRSILTVLAKRIAFLESKGLTPSEIEEALRRASHLSTSQNAFAAGYRGPYQADRDATDWRDWFVMTVIGGGVGYLLINLAKKFLIPALKPPTQTELRRSPSKTGREIR
ncbi:hypothetical protein Pst134EA_031728 [Puccinia striiformis f. sp. tritici]|uniref:uncharacterized protein n=1 Tax=Puccinia striiformis f. sp. tritici TaxID=168172 RepID=UPI0020084CD2|nr:uncharacterized protein Pst134EA_031728 [Puccinia striiformis f. sp. tritici]KAH9445197.1 hypothetical protein Pst134EA_031728 [Puccinia striiformis f. sp. tritici]